MLQVLTILEFLGTLCPKHTERHAQLPLASAQMRAAATGSWVVGYVSSVYVWVG